MPMKLATIQQSIEKRNNHGDYSAHGDDLSLAAAAAILLYIAASPSDRIAMERESARYRPELRNTCPSLRPLPL